MVADKSLIISTLCSDSVTALREACNNLAPYTQGCPGLRTIVRYQEEAEFYTMHGQQFMQYLLLKWSNNAQICQPKKETWMTFTEKIYISVKYFFHAACFAHVMHQLFKNKNGKRL